MSRSNRGVAFVIAAGIVLGTNALEGATISADHSQMLPNQSDQWITITVTGGESVSGIDLFLQVGDGGPQLIEFGLPPGKAGPVITAVELKDGTIFQGVTDLPFNLGSTQLPQTAIFALALVGTPPTVPAQGTLARVQIDTTGFFGGSWNLQMDNVLPFAGFGGPYSTNFAGAPATIQNGSISIPIARGDYNGNQQFDAADIDALAAAIRAGSVDLGRYDVNGDNAVDAGDHGFWVKQYAHIYYGDADFDGRFGTTDLIQVFAEGKYEDGFVQNAAWNSGDWDGDGDFTTSDLVTAMADGGYELGLTGAVSTVPEPSSVLLLIMGLICGASGRKAVWTWSIVEFPTF